MKNLKRVFYTPRQQASFTGIDSLTRATKNKRAKVKNWLEFQDTYTLHKQPVRQFKRRKVICAGPEIQFQADLVDVSNIKTHNDGYTFILTVIDVFSRKAYALPLKNKSAANLVAAFKILLEKHPIRYLQTDKGSEFLNRPLQTLLKKHNVHFFTTENEETKASIVERFNRTLKTKMYKYFTHNNTRNYTNVLQDLVDSYNNTFHSSIKMAPNQVSFKNIEEVWLHLYAPQKLVRPVFNTGDSVRISKTKKTFKKGYLPNWTTEIFTVHSVSQTNPPVYVLKDYNNDILKGTFYAQELQKVNVTKDKLYIVESVLGKRKRRGKTEYLVKWQGYPEKFNSWVVDLKQI